MNDSQNPSTPSDRPADLEQCDFLTRSGLAVTGMGATLLAPAQTSLAQASVATTGNGHEAFRQRTHDVRVALARSSLEVPIPPHPTNGDEARYPNRIGSDSRGLPHNPRGEVVLAAFTQALKAYASGRPEDFEKIPLGGTRKQLNPIGSLAVSLTGINAVQLAIPPAPR